MIDSGRAATDPGPQFAVTGQLPGTFFRRLLLGATGDFWSATSWTALSSAGTQAATFINTLVVARLLGREHYGRYAYVISTALAVGNLGTLGLGAAATKYLAGLRKTDTRRAGRITGLTTVVAVISAAIAASLLVLIAPTLTLQAGRPSGLIVHMRFAALYVALIIINLNQAGALMGLQAFKEAARLNIWVAGVSVLANALSTWLWGATGSLSSLVVTSALTCLVFRKTLRSTLRDLHIRVPYNFHELWRERSVLSSFCGPASVTAAISWTGIWGCNWLLAQTREGYHEVAAFGVASMMRMAVLFVPGVAQRAAGATMADALGTGQRSRYEAVFRAAFRLTLLSSLGVGVVAVVGRPLILGIFGKSYSDAGAPIALLVVASVIEAIGCMFYQVLYVAGRLWWSVGAISVWFVVLIGAATRLSSRGATGICLAYVAAWICCTIAYQQAARWVTRTS